MRKNYEERVRDYEERVKNYEEGSWKQAKKYVENDDMDSLERMVKESTRVVAETAYDLGAVTKQNSNLKKAIGIGSIAAGITAFVLYKVGRWKSYQEIIDCYEEGNNYITVEDIKTGKSYELKTECIGD